MVYLFLGQDKISIPPTVAVEKKVCMYREFLTVQRWDGENLIILFYLYKFEIKTNQQKETKMDHYTILCVTFRFIHAGQ